MHTMAIGIPKYEHLDLLWVCILDILKQVSKALAYLFTCNKSGALILVK